MTRGEGFETCTFCHRQALMTEAFRAENEELKARIRDLEAKLKKRNTRPASAAEAA
jgi:BMFP domain-containing protein YqiC